MHRADPVRSQQARIFADNILGREWRLHLTQGVQYGAVALSVRDGKRERVVLAAGSIHESRVLVLTEIRPFMHAAVDTKLNDGAIDEG